MKKITKKIAAAAACAALAVGCMAVAGCSGSGSNTNDASNSNTSAEATYTLVEQGKLTIATSPDYPPFENLVDGNAEGLDIDIASAVAEKLGLELEIKQIQFDGIITAIASGGQADMGISGFSVDPERAKEIDFTSSYYIDDQAIAAMKDGAITEANVDTALNDASMVIAVQSGTTGETYAQENFPKATVKSYGNSNDCFAALQADQANAVITNKAVVESMLGSYTDAQVVKAIATGEEYAMVVNKDNAGLTAAINDAIAALQADGTIDTLVKKWMS